MTILVKLNNNNKNTGSVQQNWNFHLLLIRFILITLFQHTHKINFHAGPQLLLSTIRNEFWPIKGKHLANKTYRNCILCYKFKPTTLHQLMGDLPASRITPARPFNTTGVDLSGPYNIKQKFQRKDTQMKAYIANFVCFVTKGTHLEIVLDLTAESLIQALKSFIARRFHPNTIWSDMNMMYDI